MAEFFAAILKWLKVGPTVWLALLGVSAFGLFAPSSLTSGLFVDGLLQQNKAYVGIIFLVSLCFLISSFVFYMIEIVKDVRMKRKENAERRKMEDEMQRHLYELTPDEKAYLSPFIIDDVNTQYFATNDGIAGGLRKKSILYYSSNMGTMHGGLPYNIQPWAKRYLQDNRQLLEGASEKPRRPPGPFSHFGKLE